MKCPKCGAESMEGSTFCVKCGTNMKEFKEEVHEEIEQAKPDVEETHEVKEEIKSEPVRESSGGVAAATAPLNYLMYLVSSVMKPKTTFEEEKEKLKDTKNAMVLAVISAGIMTILNVISTIITTVRVTSIFSETKWVWENLKYIKWFEVIGKNFLIYAGIIFAIAGVFYIASLIIKKESNFMRLLSISATSMIPFAICGMLLSPIGGIIWSTLTLVFIIVGITYSLSILYNLLNLEIKIDGDIKIYFYAACTAVLLIAGYYICLKLIVGTVANSVAGSMLGI